MGSALSFTIYFKNPIFRVVVKRKPRDKEMGFSYAIEITMQGNTYNYFRHLVNNFENSKEERDLTNIVLEYELFRKKYEENVVFGADKIELEWNRNLDFPFVVWNFELSESTKESTKINENGENGTEEDAEDDEEDELYGYFFAKLISDKIIPTTVACLKRICNDHISSEDGQMSIMVEYKSSYKGGENIHLNYQDISDQLKQLKWMFPTFKEVTRLKCN